MDQHEKQSSSTRAIRLWHLSCVCSFIAAHHHLIAVLIFEGITTPINIMEVRNESLPLRGLSNSQGQSQYLKDYLQVQYFLE